MNRSNGTNKIAQIESWDSPAYGRAVDTVRRAAGTANFKAKVGRAQFAIGLNRGRFDACCVDFSTRVVIVLMQVVIVMGGTRSKIGSSRVLKSILADHT